MFPLSRDETAVVTIEPGRGFDVGAGKRKPVEKEVRGGNVGIILDGRGRPIAFPATDHEIRQQAAAWGQAMNLYPEEFC